MTPFRVWGCTPRPLVLPLSASLGTWGGKVEGDHTRIALSVGRWIAAMESNLSTNWLMLALLAATVSLLLKKFAK